MNALKYFGRKLSEKHKVDVLIVSRPEEEMRLILAQNINKLPFSSIDTYLNKNTECSRNDIQIRQISLNWFTNNHLLEQLCSRAVYKSIQSLGCYNSIQ